MTERKELTDEYLIARFDALCMSRDTEADAIRFARDVIAADRALQGEGCTRSHPHENMSAECERKTVKARLDFLAAQHSPTVTLQGEQDALDAARYRWLRENKSVEILANVREFIADPWVDPEPTMDKAVDAARAAQGATE